MKMAGEQCRIVICICTKDRAEILERCLVSIAKGASLPESVRVSDDSDSPDATREVCARYPFVQYSTGPRRGLCANRNAVLRGVEEQFVSLIDDDGIVFETFVAQLRELLPTLPPKTILTGDVLEYGGRTTPRNPSFLGHFTRDPEGHYRTLNLNCNCFPAEAFQVASFDEQIVYGYEDMDLCSNLLSKGYSIRHEPSLVNEHRPPLRAQALDPARNRLAEQARFQTSLRRHLLWEKSLPKAMAYALAAPVHRSVYALKTRNFKDIPRSVYDVGLAWYQASAARLRGVA